MYEWKGSAGRRPRGCGPSAFRCEAGRLSPIAWRQGVYAIIETGGRQYKVSPGDVIEVNRLPVEVGQTIDLDTVLMIGDGANTQIGQSRIAGATVRAKVADNFCNPK